MAVESTLLKRNKWGRHLREKAKRVYHWCFLITLLLPVLAGMLSCNQHPAVSSHFKIGFSQCGEGDLWRHTMLADMQREMNLHNGGQLLYKQADYNSHRQIAQIRELIRQKIDLLIISPNEAAPLTPIVEEIYRSGIPVIIVDRKIDSPAYNNYIGADNHEIGKIAAAFLGNLLHNQGNVIEISGLPSSSPARERNRGFEEELQKFNGVHITHQVNGNWIPQDAEKNLLPLTGALKNTDAIFAHNDMMAWQAYQLCKSQGFNHIKIIGVDALPGAGLEMIRNKILTASILYPTGGTEAIRNAFALLEKRKVPKQTILQTIIVDSSNVDMMKLQSDKILSQATDIQQQQEKLESQEKTYKSQQVIINTLLCSLLLALLFAALLYKSRKANQQINKNLHMQNRAIERQSQQLLKMTQKANEAQEYRINFFTKLSHEFRTPLTLILAPLEELMANGHLSSQAQQHLHQIRKNTYRLLQLITQLMDFRKIEFKKMRVNAAEQDLVAFVNDVINSFSSIARKRDIDCRLLTGKRELMMDFDPDMMDKILFNLLSNAFKFTPNEGEIYVKLDELKETSEISIEVTDNGIGMGEDEKQHAFDLFYQGNELNYKGTGLGLTLVKELVSLHHGKITLRSEKNKGASFRIVFPVKQKQTQEEHAAPESATQFLIKQEIKDIYTSDLQPEAPQSGPSNNSALPANRATLLIIEDNPEIAALLSTRLSKKYEVITADNGNSGLQKAFDILPDVIICDIMLPRKNGLEITNLLKSDIRTAHIPILLLTARASEEQQLESLRHEADAFMTKPFSMTVLELTLGNLLRNRTHIKEHYTSVGILPTPAAEKAEIQQGTPQKEYKAERDPLVSASPKKKTDRRFLSDFRAIVESNIGNDQFTIEDICKALKISKVQLYRKIKSMMQVNVNEYILNVRIKKAQYYLQYEDMSISEVAYKTGFSSPAYFSTVFKGKIGMAPSNFREKFTGK